MIRLQEAQALFFSTILNYSCMPAGSFLFRLAGFCILTAF